MIKTLFAENQHEVALNLANLSSRSKFISSY